MQYTFVPFYLLCQRRRRHGLCAPLVLLVPHARSFYSLLYAFVLRMFSFVCFALGMVVLLQAGHVSLVNRIHISPGRTDAVSSVRRDMLLLRLRPFTITALEGFHMGTGRPCSI